MNKHLIIVLLGFFSLIVAGCTAQYANNPDLSGFYTTKGFTAPLDKQLEVQTGDSLLVQGTFIEGERISIENTLDLMIPGGMFIPFPLRIESGQLNMTKIDNNWKYYTATPGRFAASFPGLGSVIKEGDTAGIRISLDGKKKEWFVDNSNHNRRSTLWSKSLDKTESARYIPQKSNLPFQISHLKEIVFDGFFGDQLHFSWRESTPYATETKTFTFDFKEPNTMLGMKGYHFTAISADNIKLVYKWSPDSPSFE